LQSAPSQSKSHYVIPFSLYRVFFRHGFEYCTGGAVIEYYALIVVVRSTACSPVCCTANWFIDHNAAV